MEGVWNEKNFASLGAQQRRAVESRTPEGKTAVEYLNEIGAGLSAVDSYVESDRQANRDAMREAADAFFDAGHDSAQVLALARGFVGASEDVQVQVSQLLAPFIAGGE